MKHARGALRDRLGELKRKKMNKIKELQRSLAVIEKKINEAEKCGDCAADCESGCPLSHTCKCRKCPLSHYHTIKWTLERLEMAVLLEEWPYALFDAYTRDHSRSGRMVYDVLGSHRVYEG